MRRHIVDIAVPNDEGKDTCMGRTTNQFSIYPSSHTTFEAVAAEKISDERKPLDYAFNSIIKFRLESTEACVPGGITVVDSRSSIIAGPSITSPSTNT